MYSSSSKQAKERFPAFDVALTESLLFFGLSEAPSSPIFEDAEVLLLKLDELSLLAHDEGVDAMIVSSQLGAFSPDELDSLRRSTKDFVR